MPAARGGVAELDLRALRAVSIGTGAAGVVAGAVFADFAGATGAGGGAGFAAGFGAGGGATDTGRGGHSQTVPVLLGGGAGAGGVAHGTTRVCSVMGVCSCGWATVMVSVSSPAGSCG